MKELFWICVTVAIVLYFSSGNNVVKLSGIDQVDTLVSVKIDRSKHYATLSNTSNSTTLSSTTVNATLPYTNTK